MKQLIQKEKLCNAAIKVNEFAKKTYTMGASAVMMLMLTAQPLMAEDTIDIFDKAGAFANSLYLRFTAISTVFAVTAATLALIIRMLSKNQKAVDESGQWLKRIVICYALINCMGLIVNFIQPYLVDAGWSYDGDTGGTAPPSSSTTT